MTATAARPSRRVATALLTPVIVVAVAAQVGDAMMTTWADTHPVALMSLNSRNRILLLVTNQLDPVTYYVIGTVRLMLTDPLYFMIGRVWGPRGLTWMREKSGGGLFARFLNWLERNFDRAAVPFIVIMPNPFISLMAGATRMRASLFFALNFVGTVGRLYLLRRLGEAFAEDIESVLGFFARYRLPLLALSVSIVVFSVARRRRTGTGELEEIRALEHELTTEAE